jgi:hypothetical protein
LTNQKNLVSKLKNDDVPGPWLVLNGAGRRRSRKHKTTQLVQLLLQQYIDCCDSAIPPCERIEDNAQQCRQESR